MRASVERARRLIVRPGAWLDAGEGAQTYVLRLAPGRRHRAIATLDEPVFLALIEAPGLRRRHQGGWEARTAPPTERCREVGSPGRVEGERTLVEADGRSRRVRANLGQSPIQWLASRRDTEGRPYLTPAEVAAGERLRSDGEIALSGPSVTMRWDALPRAGGGSAARVEPGDRALNAADRVRRALAACPADTHGVLVQICIRETALQIAERELGLPSRHGKRRLKAGLQSLARHYGLS